VHAEQRARLTHVMREPCARMRADRREPRGTQRRQLLRREILHERIAHPAAGHLGAGAEDAIETARLSAAGTAYYAWIEKARAILQAGPEGLSRADRAVVEELRRSGLLAAD